MTTPIAEQFAAIAARLAELRPAATVDDAARREAEQRALTQAYMGVPVTDDAAE